MENVSYAECKAPGKLSLTALVTTGSLSAFHTLSHVMPALGVLGYSASSEHIHSESGIASLLSHPVLELSYIAFVTLSLYHVIKDHKSHQKYHAMQQRVSELEAMLKENEKSNQ